MPTISMFYGILIKMFFDDHAPPHFHAEYRDYPNDHEESFITPENERYCAGGSGTRSIKFLEI
jgi:Domain of unknown function (DUF4160)